MSKILFEPLTDEDWAKIRANLRQKEIQSIYAQLQGGRTPCGGGNQTERALRLDELDRRMK